VVTVRGWNWGLLAAVALNFAIWGLAVVAIGYWL
jgi:hypothetical protein